MYYADSDYMQLQLKMLSFWKYTEDKHYDSTFSHYFL